MAYTVINPADETVVTTVQRLDIEEVDAAIFGATVAQKEWARRAPLDRATLLRRFAEAVDRDLENLAQLETRNSGHPITQARGEAASVRDVLEYYSGAPERLIGQQIPVSGGMNVTFHEPMGVIGIITPWNFPMSIAAWGFAPALAAGNAVLLKPAEWTSLTSIRLGELALEAGLPEGLFQVTPGQGPVVGERFVTHPDVRKVVFTGSTEVGKRIMAGASEQVKRVTLELGGKSANIIFGDADVEAAALAAPSSVFDNAGQDCCARSRLLVQRGVFDRFMNVFEGAVQDLRVGDPLDPDTEMGPLVTLSHRDHVTSFVDDDSLVAFRGSCPSGPGAWFPPTVMTPSRDHRVVEEEVFGPVVAVLPFDDEADAIKIANDSKYGLSGSIWTQDLSRAIRVSRAVESGTLSVNSHSSVRYSAPFGGMKQSGIGRELGPDAPLQFSETKSVFYAASEN
ncbi:aldehyde dehydrogenase family protein [Brevibacterium aurantiacum]|uniref:aldehyde dehydrogenase family protein n=1 Tax=Brevibacterium aurantiacum TaxID=273384 RepID=UPI001866F833|nr:aldehyde dehydrogenase family protein [Brevibacterium aurantiacum]